RRPPTPVRRRLRTPPSSALPPHSTAPPGPASWFSCCVLRPTWPRKTRWELLPPATPAENVCSGPRSDDGDDVRDNRGDFSPEACESRGNRHRDQAAGERILDGGQSFLVVPERNQRSTNSLHR